MNGVKLRLCGGTFFMLLLEARKQGYGAREHYSGLKDGLTEPDTLFGLAKIVVPDWQKPRADKLEAVKTSTTSYKLCTGKGGPHFPFNDRNALRAFDERIKSNYSEVLTAMWAFRDAFLEIQDSTKKDESLVRALVELISEDDSIDAEQLFYASPNGTAVKKRDLVKCRSVCYEAFLLGVFHFAITRKEPATIGQDTVNLWCPPTGGGPREYKGEIGLNWPSIVLSYYQPTEDVADDNCSESDTSDTTSVDQEASQDGNAETTTAPIFGNQQVVFIQNGANSTQIAKVDNLTINL